MRPGFAFEMPLGPPRWRCPSNSQDEAQSIAGHRQSLRLKGTSSNRPATGSCGAIVGASRIFSQANHPSLPPLGRSRWKSWGINVPSHLGLSSPSSARGKEAKMAEVPFESAEPWGHGGHHGECPSRWILLSFRQLQSLGRYLGITSQ